jgi:hypothetical protein
VLAVNTNDDDLMSVDHNRMMYDNRNHPNHALHDDHDNSCNLNNIHLIFFIIEETRLIVKNV